MKPPQIIIGSMLALLLIVVIFLSDENNKTPNNRYYMDIYPLGTVLINPTTGDTVAKIPVGKDKFLDSVLEKDNQ